MSEFPKDIFIEQFTEIYVGVPKGSPTWVVSNQPDSGVFGSISGLDAEQASARPSGSLSIAAHVEHLRWSMAYALAFYRGEHPSPDWSGSWSVQAVDERGWRSLRDDLRSTFEELKEAIQHHQDWSNRAMVAGTLALVPHGAYHLALVRHLRQQL